MILIRGMFLLAALALVAGLSVLESAAATEAQARWMLMSRQGECVELNSLKSKIPELPPVSEPLELSRFLDAQGHFVAANELRGSAGRAHEIKVSDLSLHLILVRESLCSNYE